MAFFDTVIYRIQDLGIDTVILPFILIFTILYAIMDKVNFLAKKDDPKSGRRFNIVIAFVITALVIIPHVTHSYPADRDPIDIINNILPGAALIIVTVVVVLIVAALVMGADASKLFMGGSAVGSLIAIAALLAIGGVIAYNIFPTILPDWAYGWLQDEATQALILLIGIFVLIVGFITSEPKKEKKSFAKVINDFGKDWSG